MALTLIQPPTMHELMDDLVFAKMMRTRPRIPSNLTRPTQTPAWHVWRLTTEDKWQRGRYSVYDDAYRKMKELLADRHTADIAIVSIRFLMPPPANFIYRPRRNPWCGRCRRPSLFTEQWDHRALRHSDMTFDEPVRCHYCGIRRAALPHYSPS
jgi:DNA-directed RNA polymerase subunit RPC12/RpoP